MKDGKHVDREGWQNWIDKNGFKVAEERFYAESINIPEMILRGRKKTLRDSARVAEILQGDGRYKYGSFPVPHFDHCDYYRKNGFAYVVAQPYCTAEEVELSKKWAEEHGIVCHENPVSYYYPGESRMLIFCRKDAPIWLEGDDNNDAD